MRRQRPSLARQGHVGDEGTPLGAETAIEEAATQGTYQAEQGLRTLRCATPQDARAGKAAKAIKRQPEWTGPNAASRPLGANAPIEVQLAKKDERDMQISGVGQTPSMAWKPSLDLFQSRPLHLARPEGEEQAVGRPVSTALHRSVGLPGEVLPQTNSSSLSRARRTDWWRTSSRLPANCTR